MVIRCGLAEPDNRLRGEVGRRSVPRATAIPITRARNPLFRGDLISHAENSSALLSR